MANPSQNYIDFICSLYNSSYDDRIENTAPPTAGGEDRTPGEDWMPGVPANHKSLISFQRELAEQGIRLSTSKIKKILITGGLWTTQQTRTIQGLLYSIVAISVFVGLITVICTIMINWEISKKEYAVLKSVGATTKRVLYIVLAEKAIICLLSGVIGSGLGIGIERLAAIAFKGVPFRPPITEIIVSLLMMLLISLLATYIQGGSLKNIRIAEVMNKAE